MTESAYIDAINANPDDRLPQFVYADWLDEMGDPRGEAWRVLIEAGKRPSGDVAYFGENGYFHTFQGWQWFPRFAKDNLSDDVWMRYAPNSVVDRDLWNAMKFFRQPTFYLAMNVAAVAWVRCHVDADFEPDLLHRS